MTSKPTVSTLGRYAKYGCIQHKGTRCGVKLNCLYSHGLESYTQIKARADEFEAKMKKTDALIDDIIYERYGLTAEQTEIVEEAVSE